MVRTFGNDGIAPPLAPRQLAGRTLTRTDCLQEGLKTPTTNSMYSFIKYLAHLLKATNQHGVHSPFVYNYVTKCLYGRKRYSADKKINVLFKSIAYFKAERVSIISKNPSLENQIQKEFDLSVFEDMALDLVYHDNPQSDIVDRFKDSIHNNSVILIGNIYKKRENTVIWEQLKQREIITVSLDLFYCGILFIRTQQAKEHFKIRI